jgi:polyribonucleotide nucleotidyltransferase
MTVKKEIEIGGKLLSVETNKFAKQANGAVMVTYGETMILVTAVSAEQPKEDVDFFPLQVEYREKATAAGKFPGGFFKREGKPSEKEILSARLIDRPIRPLFPEQYKNETQIVATVFSFDGENDADVLGAFGASAALTVSDIPFDGPVAEVRVARSNDGFIVNPTHQQVKDSDIELVVAGTADSIMMVEGEAQQVSEEVLLAALKFAHEGIKKLVALQVELRAAFGKPKREVPVSPVSAELDAAVSALAAEKINALVSTVFTKEERSQKNKAIAEEVKLALAEQFPEQEKLIDIVLHDLEKKYMRERILDAGLRLDGRKTTEIRAISIELGLLPRVHGSALFTRGETQSLGSVTLGTKDDEQIIDGLLEEYTKRFMLHYNFPPYSVGEVGRMTGVGRREIGHGNLAERSLKVVLPNDKDFPYAIRFTSDILESNGSSSMATVCAGSLSLMDGGVPVSAAVAGIAMGLIKEGERYAILSDILGNEDHLGDMDFKVAGTAAGITGFQMDIKIQGISFEIMEKALAQAKDGRMHILGIMNEAIAAPRADLSKYAPRMLTIDIDPEQIGGLIGSAGKTVQKIQRQYGVEISIEDSGAVHIASPNLDNASKCRDFIARMTKFPEVGAIYEGEVVKILDFGALVELVPGKSGMVHISEMDFHRVKKVTDVMNLGDIVRVKLLKVENGKYSLSRKAVLKMEQPPKHEGSHEKPEHE